MHINAYESSRLHFAARVVRAVDNLPARTIGGTVLVFGLLATLAYHANEPVQRRSHAPAAVCVPAVVPHAIKEV